MRKVRIEKKNRKTEFIILRVTSPEKDYLIKRSNVYFKNISRYIRVQLGLDRTPIL